MTPYLPANSSPAIAGIPVCPPTLEPRLPVGLAVAVTRAALALLLLTVAPLRAMDHSMPPLDLRAFATAAADSGGLAPGTMVPNFRLTDHTGTTRELYYESTAKAIVLVFTGT